MDIKQGSRWYTSDGISFIVDYTEHINGKDWIFYHLANKDPHEEEYKYSCYREAFTQRFWEYTNEY